MKKYAKLRFVLMGILLILFIAFKILKSDTVTLRYAQKYQEAYNAERKNKGIYPLNMAWPLTVKTKKTDDLLELVYIDTDSLKTHHTQKTIYLRPGYLFWNPFIYEETDVFVYKQDSITNMVLTAVYAHQYVHGEDPWGLSFLEIKKYGKVEKTKSVNKQKMDSILKTWK